jgi:type I restriction enzyme, S subunit
MALGITPDEIVAKGEYPLLSVAERWERVYLYEVASVQNGFAFKSEFFDRENGMPLIRIRDICSSETEHRYTGQFEDTYLVRKGEILIGMDGDFTASRWAGEDALLNQRVCKVSLESDLFSEEFLLLCLQPYLDAINAETSSITVKHLSSRTVEKIPLPLPPLNEQHRIVGKLDALFSELENALENLNSARAQLKVHRQAVLKAAFQGKLTELWRSRKGDGETANRLLERIRCDRQSLYQREMSDWKKAVAKLEDNGKSNKPKKPKALKILPGPSEGELQKLDALPEAWQWAKVGQLASVGTGVTPLKSNRGYYD